MSIHGSIEATLSFGDMIAGQYAKISNYHANVWICKSVCYLYEVPYLSGVILLK